MRTGQGGRRPRAEDPPEPVLSHSLHTDRCGGTSLRSNPVPALLQERKGHCPPPPLWRQHPCPHGYVPEQTKTMAVKSTTARGAAGTSSSQFVRDSRFQH